MRLASLVAALAVALTLAGCTQSTGAGSTSSPERPVAAELRAVIGRQAAATPTMQGSASPTAAPTTGSPALKGVRAVPAALLAQYGKGDAFFAHVLHRSGTGDVELASAVTGQPLWTLMPSHQGRLFVVSLAEMSSHRLMVTLGTGDNCSNNTAGCGPLPDVCGGQAVVVDLATGAATAVWSWPRSVHVDGAAPSPDGTRIAARTSTCQGWYGGDYLQVIRMADRASWTIGAAVKGCHWLTQPSWTGSGTQLVFAYAPPTSATNCSPSTTQRAVAVAAGRGQPGYVGTVGLPVGHCSYSSVVARGTNVYAFAQCAKNGYDDEHLDGPTRLVRLATRLAPKQSWPQQTCGNGSAIAINHAGEVLLARYHYCAHAVHGKSPVPENLLYRLHGTSLDPVRALENVGWFYWDSPAW